MNLGSSSDSYTGAQRRFRSAFVLGAGSAVAVCLCSRLGRRSRRDRHTPGPWKSLPVGDNTPPSPTLQTRGVRTSAETSRFSNGHLTTRLETLLPSHYLSLFNTLKSVTLAAAGFAVARLLVDPAAKLMEERLLLWILFVNGVLAASVTFAGNATGVIFLPREFPGLSDTVIPFLLGLSEFTLFALLATSSAATVDVVPTWFLVFFVFAVCASLTILNIRHRIRPNSYEHSIRLAVATYRRRLLRDATGALMSATVALALALGSARGDLDFVLVLAGSVLTAVGLVGALVAQHNIRRMLHRAIRAG